MPLKRPKADKLPKPFRDIEAEHDESDRFRIMSIQRELDRIDGVSWNQPTPGFMGRLQNLPSYKIWATLPALGMGLLIIGSLWIVSNVGLVNPNRVIWVENWSATRTSNDAVEDRRRALAELKADIDRTLAVVEPKAETDEDAATHAAALRRYAAMAEQEGAQREREMAERSAAAK